MSDPALMVGKSGIELIISDGWRQKNHVELGFWKHFGRRLKKVGNFVGVL